MTTRSADITLADGSTAHVRQIGPADADKIVDLHARLSERTRYLRYQVAGQCSAVEGGVRARAGGPSGRSVL
jgi:hypothetical protein